METKPEIRIGSRESKLAVIQSEIVQRHLQEKYPEGEITLITMKTTGDKILDRTLDKIGGKGLFVKELDLALMEKRTDLSVHSLKDMPMEVPEELPILAFSRREDPRDVLVLPKGKTEIDFLKPIGCSSMRRILQFQKLYPQAVFKPIRGNVQTRLRKLDDGEYSATLLAAAGLKRLGLENRISRYFEPEEMIPVYADPDRLRQVFINILDNAIKYSAPGGRITVKLWAGEYKAFVEILDQGRGIPPEDLENVKTKFYKGSNAVRGSGIGLALVDSIMTALDGTLDIKIGRASCRERV